MWRDKVIEAKAIRKITNKQIADYVHASEKTIVRLLNGDTLFASLDLVLKVGEAVGLSAIELFNETNSIVGGDELIALHERLDCAEAELDRVRKEYDSLYSELRDRTHELEIIKIKLESSERIISLQDEVIKLQDYIKNTK